MRTGFAVSCYKRPLDIRPLLIVAVLGKTNIFFRKQKMKYLKLKKKYPEATIEKYYLRSHYYSLQYFHYLR